MTADRDTWLAQQIEMPLDPELPVCDAHHHLWEYPENRYLLEELRADAEGHHVVSTVFIECSSKYRESGPEAMKPIGETEFVEALANDGAARAQADAPAVAGIVSFADLSLGSAVAAVLEAHLAASPGRFRGIRHACGWDASEDVRNSHTKPPEGLLMDPVFREGFACLEKYGLSFDAWLYHTQLAELVDLAQAFPGVTVILDHVGGPLGIGPYAGQRAEIFAGWKTSIAALAECPNVVVKLGGLAMPLNGWGWHKQERPPGSEELCSSMGPYYLFCIEEFSPERCLFESNFPVDKASCSYTVLWNAFKRMTRDFSSEERAALFHDTASRVYRLRAG